MFVLFQITPNSANAIAVSESQDKLSERLKQEARDFVIPRYDDDYLEEVLEMIDIAYSYWSDEDDEWPFTLSIQEVPVI